MLWILKTYLDGDLAGHWFHQSRSHLLLSTPGRNENHQRSKPLTEQYQMLGHVCCSGIVSKDFFGANIFLYLGSSSIMMVIWWLMTGSHIFWEHIPLYVNHLSRLRCQHDKISSKTVSIPRFGGCCWNFMLPGHNSREIIVVLTLKKIILW